jgi:hypothetical protein
MKSRPVTAGEARVESWLGDDERRDAEVAARLQRHAPADALPVWTARQARHTRVMFNFAPVSTALEVLERLDSARCSSASVNSTQ